MTYLQFMMKCLKFYKDDNNKFDSYDFYYHWLRNDDDDVEDYYKDQAKKAIMYLFLLESKEISETNTKFLKFLEKELAYFDISMTKTIKKAEKKVEDEMKEDPYLADRLLLLEIDELSPEETNEIFLKYTSEVFDEINKGLEIDKLESGIHTVMEMVSQIIPELFFTEKGYKYIDKEYQIEDKELRDKCYEYLKNNISYYNTERVYKVNESLYNSDLYELGLDDEENIFEQDEEFEDEEFDDEYEVEDEADEEEYNGEEFDIELLDDDELRSEVDVWSDDIDNFDILFYSVTLLFVVLKLVKNKEYDKLDKLIELDEKMTNCFWLYGSYHEKTVVEAFYEPKSMGRDYKKEISVNPKGDYYLDFFLSDNEFTRQYDLEQLALIACFCFDYYADDPIGKINNNLDRINGILGVKDNSVEENTGNGYVGRNEKIKQFYKIRTNND